jgi:hypothetical protein
MFFRQRTYAFILEGRKESDMGTCDSDGEKTKCKIIKKEDHCKRDCVLFKEWLQQKRILDNDPRKEIEQ